MPENKEGELPAIFQKLAVGDETAVKECIDTYGNLIWELAKQYADSLEEAEAATLEIFQDIWEYYGKCDSALYNEKAFILLLAKRRLIKRAEENK
jgi:DNA-directed RNA polymerase specialized sigma24 family protein